MPTTTKVLVLSTVAVAAVGAVIASYQLAIAQGTSGTASPTPASAVVGELDVNEGIFVDGKTFKIAKGKAKGDPTAAMAKLGAKEVGPGAIIFRYGDKLYLAEGTPGLSPQAMKNFQDEWAVGYMKAFKEFQDHWAVSYMKNTQAALSPKDQAGIDTYQTAMKNFQDNWAVGYMKQMKEFQDHWAVSYAKEFQDHWNVSYMNSVKNFQDTFTMMK